MKAYIINPLGDRALLVTFQATEKEHIPLFVRAFDRAHIPGTIDIVAAFDSVAIYYDPVKLFEQRSNSYKSPYKAMLKAVEDVWDKVRSSGSQVQQANKTLSIPVCYDPQCGLDLHAISKKTGIPSEDIITSHTENEHTVEMIGFSPGFPYLSGLDERLNLPRKKSPRTSVPAGSVAIAGKFTGIYSLPTPGGWHIIGRTPIMLFDRNEHPPVRLETGDRVKFYAISYDAFVKGEY